MHGNYLRLRVPQHNTKVCSHQHHTQLTSSKTHHYADLQIGAPRVDLRIPLEELRERYTGGGLDLRAGVAGDGRVVLGTALRSGEGTTCGGGGWSRGGNRR